MNKKYSTKNVFNKDGSLLPIVQRTFITNEGYECILIDGGTKVGFVTVNIGEYVTEARTGDVKRGEVANPLHKSKLGIGYIGIGKYKPSNYKTANRLWHDMLRRAYDSEYHKRQPTYKDVTVHDDWHSFQVFADWFYNESNYQDGWHLDKDLLSTETKMYSSSTCIFIPQALNNFLLNNQATNTSGHPGVSWSKVANKWMARIKLVETQQYKSLGVFTIKEEAIKVYQIKRAEQAQIWKSKMGSILPTNALKQII